MNRSLFAENSELLHSIAYIGKYQSKMES